MQFNNESRKEMLLEAVKKNPEELDREINEIINSHVKEKDKKKIHEFLNKIIQKEIGEDGGRNALTGFYFQLLCTIYYLAELIEGKWDFLVIELHQDIIVGNDETVRFIQVKSEVTPNRKIAKEVTKTKLYTDGWVQKLISMAKLFPKGENVKTEFELLTNFMIKDSPRVQIEHYLYNKDYNHVVKDDDNLLLKVSENSTVGVGKNFSYEDSCKETIQELLTRFRINPKGLDTDNLDDFMNSVSKKLGNLIHKSIGISVEDINFILGELCFECSHSNQGSLMYIDKERAQKFLESLRGRVSNDLEGFYTENNKNEVIKEIVKKLADNYSNLADPIKKQMLLELENFRSYLKNSINDDLTINNLVHRYLEGKEFSLKLESMSGLAYKSKVEEIFKTILMLKMVLSNNVNFSKSFTSILINEATSSYISLVGLDIDQTMDEGMEKLRNILSKMSDEEKLLILMQNNFVIFQGEYDDSDINRNHIFDLVDAIDIDKIIEDKSITKVEYESTILPGKEVVNHLKKVRRYPDIQRYKEYIREEMKSIL